MFNNFGEMQKEGFEVAAQAFGAASQGAQTIANEGVEFARKAFEDGAAAMEKLLSARSLDRAMEVQGRYAQTALDGFVAQATKFGEMYSNAAKQAFRPLEGYLAKARPTA